MLKNLYPLLKYIRRYWPAYLIGCVIILIETGASLSIPQVVQWAIDGLKPGDAAAAAGGSLLTYFGYIMGLSAVFGFALFSRRSLMIGASRKIEYDLRHDYFDQLLQLSPSFYDRRSTGDLISRSTSDLNNIRDVMGPGMMYMAETVTLLPLALILMLRTSVPLTLVGFIPLAIIGILGKLMGGRLHRRFSAVQEQMGTLSSFVQENLTGIRVIKAYTREDYQSGQFATINQDLLQRNLAMARLQGIIFPGFMFTAAVGVLILIGMGGALVIREALSRGELVKFMFYMVLLSGPMLTLGWILNVFQRGDASMARFNDIMRAEPEIQNAPGAIAPADFRGDIAFRGLTFRYDGAPGPALSEIDLTVPAGSTLAIVGHTGSGKSTLAGLLLRLYKPPEGTVFLDGVDVNQYDLDFLRGKIGYVSQEGFLFSDSLAENIAFGLSEYTPEQVELAAERAHILDDVREFPEQFDTRIGERGVTLSGGQRQRTALARALVLEPRILVLDDVLSAVDTHTEEIILGHLARVMSGRTSIIISHRISTVQMADQIAVLEEGRVVELGTHRELLARNGIYAEIYRRQLLSEAIEAE